MSYSNHNQKSKSNYTFLGMLIFSHDCTKWDQSHARYLSKYMALSDTIPLYCVMKFNHCCLWGKNYATNLLFNLSSSYFPLDSLCWSMRGISTWGRWVLSLTVWTPTTLALWLWSRTWSPRSWTVTLTHAGSTWGLMRFVGGCVRACMILYVCVRRVFVCVWTRTLLMYVIVSVCRTFSSAGYWDMQIKCK